MVLDWLMRGLYTRRVSHKPIKYQKYLKPPQVNKKWFPLTRPQTRPQATQSSVAFNGYAEKAIDGNRNNVFEYSHSCSHTKRQNHPSWTVTLPTQHRIAVVKVTDRMEKQDRGRLNGFSIHVGSTQCADNIQIANGETKAIVCNAVGNKIKITAREYLVLCT